MNSAARGSVGFQAFKPTTESTRGKNHSSVRYAGRVSVSDPTFKPIRESTQERNRISVMPVERAFAGARAFSFISESTVERNSIKMEDLVQLTLHPRTHMETKLNKKGVLLGSKVFEEELKVFLHLILLVENNFKIAVALFPLIWNFPSQILEGSSRIDSIRM